MNGRRMIAIIAVLAVLAFGTLIPSPARASAVTDALILTGIAVGAYAAFVIITTSLIYGPPTKLTLTPADVDARRGSEEPAVRVGPRCRQASTTLTLVCW
jgi:hypothetical protein